MTGKGAGQTVLILAIASTALGTSASGQTRAKKRARPEQLLVERGHVFQGRFAPSVTFRLLLIIKPIADIRTPTFLPIRNEMSVEDVRAVSRAFQEYFPEAVSIRTEGRVAILADVAVSDLPLRTTDLATDRQSGYAWGEDLYEDIDRVAPVGAYDGLFYYYKHVDDATGYVMPRVLGLTVMAQTPSAGYAGQSTIHWRPATVWTRESHSYEIFLHEWLHQLEAFYSERGVRLPRGGLHGAEVHGHRSSPPEYWEPWYGDFLNGKVREADGDLAGLGDRAWEHGTIREAALLRPPPTDRPPPRPISPQRYDIASWLKPATIARRKSKFNVLTDPSFEDERSPWNFRSWRDRPESQRRTMTKPHHGKMTASFNVENDAATLFQSVKVKTYSNYLLTGWVRTENLGVTQAGGRVGAHLEVMAVDRVQGRSVLASAPWTYIVAAFYTGPKTEVEVAIQVGGHASLVTGKAWFDDLCLLEIED